jgi:hypothetical protein
MQINRILRTCAYALCVIALAMIGCSRAPTPNDAASNRPSPAFEQLSFNERMAIRAQLTQIKAEAQRRANEIYDPFKSRKAAMANEAYATRLRVEGENDLKEELNLTDADLERIVEEYLERQGVRLTPTNPR